MFRHPGAIPGQPDPNRMQSAAQQLYEAMRGAGTDEKAIGRIAAGFNFMERATVAQVFQQMYGKSLEGELKRELTGNVERMLRIMFQDKYTAWAKLLNKTMKGAGTDEKRLIQLTLIMSDYDFQQVSQRYLALYQKDLYAHICSETARSDWAKLVKGWLRGNNTGVADPNQVAQMLHTAASGSGTDEDVFVEAMCNASPEVYRQAVACYCNMYGKTLEQTIKKEFAGKSEDAFLLCHQYLMNPALAVSNLLHESMHGGGTDDQLLIFVTMAFSEFFRGQLIRDAYQVYGDLQRAIKIDITGKYEDVVLILWGFK
ncbi:Annexin_9 [Hexamita inflata]|uniref:Annexin 9 n=1 Tax=Hexamita inflata TaxID=28002 RepID=A0AA86NIV6_9EUKA|nr:Annexin 9 [Hexamita inflata]